MFSPVEELKNLLPIVIHHRWLQLKFLQLGNSLIMCQRNNYLRIFCSACAILHVLRLCMYSKAIFSTTVGIILVLSIKFCMRCILVIVFTLLK